MLKDQDRIFTNLYGMHERTLKGAQKRGHWDGTAALIKKRLSVGDVELERGRVDSDRACRREPGHRRQLLGRRCHRPR